MASYPDQINANIDFPEAYAWIFVSIVGAFCLRRVYYETRRFQLSRAAKAKTLPDSPYVPKSKPSGYRIIGISRFETLLLQPIKNTAVAPWQFILVLAILAVNIGFITAISTNVPEPYTPQYNPYNTIGNRCGHIALVHIPIVISLTGKNSLVAIVTGISHNYVRFAHKTFGYSLFLLALLHWSLVITSWEKYLSGPGGVRFMFEVVEIADYGPIAFAGIFLSVLSSFYLIRRFQYESFLWLHIAGVCIMFGGIWHHLPGLRVYSVAGISIWAIERGFRLFQYFGPLFRRNYLLRSPVLTARATVTHGAIVLRVPFTGEWTSGQYAFLGFPTIPQLWLQTHPFSIANVSPSYISGENSMVFVMRVHKGMTKTLANKLEGVGEGADVPLKITLEGPYGRAYDTRSYQSIGLLAGGSGITHVLSILSQILRDVQTNAPGFQSVNLTWAVQHISQVEWVTDELVAHLYAAERLPNLDLKINLYKTRDSNSEKSRDISNTSSTKNLPLLNASEEAQLAIGRSRTSSAAAFDTLVESGAITVNSGRPNVMAVLGDIKRFASGNILFSVCGPGKFAEDVRGEAAKLRSQHSIELEVAHFEM